MKKIIILSLILVFFCCCFAFAQTTIHNPIPIDTFEELISKLIDYIIGIALVVAPLIIVFAGFSYATAGGDTGKIEKAKTMLLYAAVGLGVVLLAKSLVDALRKIIVLPSDM